MRIPLPLHSYRTDATSAATSRLVNAYAEAAPQPSKAPVIARRAPGVTQLSLGFAGSPGRGLHLGINSVWAVIGTQIVRYTPGGGTVTLGNVPGIDFASFADNGEQLIVVAGGTAYVSNPSLGSFAEITDADFEGANCVSVLDGYAIFTRDGSQEFQYSAIGDATDIDALDFASAEGMSDNLVGNIVDRRRLFLFGTETTELWYNSGDADNPFQRVPEGFVQLGCIGSRAFCRNELGVFMVASDRTARQWTGNGWARISQHGVEQAWRDYAGIDDCKAFTYTHDGHIFVAFRFGAAAATWVYDCTTTEWHERATPAAAFDGVTAPSADLPHDGNWRVCDAVTRGGVTYVQDRIFGSVGQLSQATYKEFGNTDFPTLYDAGTPLVSEFTFAPVYVNNRPVYHRELEIVMETGVGTTAVSNPQIRLQYKDSDGNGQWTEAPPRSLGAEGNRRLRVRWHRLGYARDRVYRLIVSDAVKVVIVDAQLEAEIGG